MSVSVIVIASVSEFKIQIQMQTLNKPTKLSRPKTKFGWQIDKHFRRSRFVLLRNQIALRSIEWH